MKLQSKFPLSLSHIQTTSLPQYIRIVYTDVIDREERQEYLLPPSESCRSLVSLESLYGTWLPFLVASPSADITLPRASCQQISIVKQQPQQIIERLILPACIFTRIYQSS